MDQTARKAGLATIDLADEMSGYFRDMCEKLNISYSEFVRTTEPRHHAASIELWRRMKDICIAVRQERVILSRWSTTVLNTG